MTYQGSKQKYLKQIVPILQKAIDDSVSRAYYEPFVGGANVIACVNADFRFGSDANSYVIELLRNLHRLEELPEDVTRDLYNKCRFQYNIGYGDFEKWYVAAIGFLASYSGRFYSGGFGAVANTTGGVRHYYQEKLRNLMKQRDSLKGVEFSASDYVDLSIPDGAVVYCDPPYDSTKPCDTKPFDSKKFWTWAASLSGRARVFVSEQSAPDGWNAVWEQKVTRSIDHKNYIKKTEKLFVLGGAQ